METYLEVWNERDHVWIGYDSRCHDYLVEAFRKVDGGVRHFVGRYKHARLALIYHDLKKAHLSKRPFQVGQGCDGSGTACCYALFHSFCLSKGLDAVELHRKAYQKREGIEYQKLRPAVILELADWQGVVYPDQWNESAYRGLIESLVGINNTSLVTELESAVEALETGIEKRLCSQLQLSFEVPTDSTEVRTQAEILEQIFDEDESNE